jgi:hypothetical protein
MFIFGSGGCVEPLREREAIDRVNTIEKAGSTRGFVALQMTDQVPGGFEICKRRKFTFEFLDAVFAEMARAGLVGRDNGAGWMCLCYRDNRDFFGATASTMRSAGDAFAKLGEILGNRRGHLRHSAILARRWDPLPRRSVSATHDCLRHFRECHRILEISLLFLVPFRPSTLSLLTKFLAMNDLPLRRKTNSLPIGCVTRH